MTTYGLVPYQPPSPCPHCHAPWERTELTGEAQHGGGYRVHCHECGREWDDPNASPRWTARLPEENLLRGPADSHTPGMSGTSPRTDPGPCDLTRSCIFSHGHRGACRPKICAREGCENRTRNIHEKLCTRHEDRSTYKRYQSYGLGNEGV